MICGYCGELITLEQYVSVENGFFYHCDSTKGCYFEHFRDMVSAYNRIYQVADIDPLEEDDDDPWPESRPMLGDDQTGDEE